MYQRIKIIANNSNYSNNNNNDNKKSDDKSQNRSIGTDKLFLHF